MTDIPGLASRVQKPLEFLGLLNTADDACFRLQIPAKRVLYSIKLAIISLKLFD